MRPGRKLHSVGILLVRPRTHHLLTEDLALHTNFQTRPKKRAVALLVFLAVSGDLG